MVDSAFTAVFRYDLDGLLVGAGVDSVDYRASVGLPDSTTLAGFTATSSLAYDGAGALADLYYAWSGGSFLQSYARDPLGRITTLYDAVSGDTARTYDYVYTTAGRLKQVKSGGNILQHFEYDANGNRTLTLGASLVDSASATYDGQDRLVRYGNVVLSYTKNGELRQKISGTDTTSYAYDELGNLVKVIQPNKDRIDYVIDGMNRRVGRTANGHALTGWLYGDQLHPVAELDSVGSVTARYVYGSRSNVPDYVVKGSTTYRIVSDQLGSVRLVVNASNGTVAEKIRYDAWGKVIEDSSPGFITLGYAGGITDPDTKLVRFGARDYDPGVGRWMCKDPARFRGRSASLYEYAHSDPINLADAAGLGCRAPYLKRVLTNMAVTNEGGGHLIAGGLDIAMGIKLGEETGTMTIYEWGMSGFPRLAAATSTFTGFETVVIVGAATVYTAIITLGFFELGVGVGSLINAAIDPDIGSDGQEACPCTKDSPNSRR
jgi:RHS repeat-associated protein